MSTEALLAWCALAAVLTVTPGVDMAIVARCALAGGRGAGVRAAGGIATGTLVWGAASALGVAALLAASATLYDVLRLAGAAYLVWLGIRALRPSRGAAPETSADVPGRRAFLTGLGANLGNPKIVVFYSTVLPGFIGPDASVLAWSVVLAGIHAVFGLVWLSAYAAGVERLGRVAGAWLDRVTGVVLVALGVRLATDP